MHPHIYPPASIYLNFGVYLVNAEKRFEKTAFWQNVEYLYSATRAESTPGPNII